MVKTEFQRIVFFLKLMIPRFSILTKMAATQVPLTRCFLVRVEGLHTWQFQTVGKHYIYTVLFAMNVAVEFLPFSVVYKGNKSYELWMVGGPKNWQFACSKSG